VKRLRDRRGLTAALLVLVTLLGSVFLFVVGIDALEGRSDFHFYADSSTYHEAARGNLAGIETPADLIGIAGNFLGPLLLLRLTGDNYYLVLLVNATMMFLSVASIAKTLKLDSLRLAVLLLLNPLTVSSLLAVNKEILSLVFVALLLRAYSEGSLLSWVAAALVSMLARWQLAVFLIALSFAVSSANPFTRNRLRTILFLLLGLSVLYLQLSTVFESIRFTFAESAAEYEGSGFYEWLQGWQEAGAYWIIFPLKALHLLFGMGLRFDRLLAPEDVYNDVWQLLHSTMTLVLFIALVKQRLFKLENDLIYISVFYLAIFAMSPIYTPRYFYPLYVLWAAALASRAPIVHVLRGGKSSRSGRRPSHHPETPVLKPAIEGAHMPDNTP
jgi:hypothetical protein